MWHLHDGNCHSPAASFAASPISSPQMLELGGQCHCCSELGKARQLHGSTSGDETQSQGPIARQLLDWKANTPTFSASPPLPSVQLRFLNPSFRQHLGAPRRPTLPLRPHYSCQPASQASVPTTGHSLALTTIAASISLFHNHPAGLLHHYSFTAIRQV